MLDSISKRLRVAHVIPDLDLNVTGGVGVFLRTLLQCLDHDRIENIVVTFKSEEGDRQFFEHLGIRVFSHLPTANIDIEPSIKVMEWLIKIFQAISPDVVHTNLFWADTLGRQAAYRAKVPVIVTTENNQDLQETPRQRAIKRQLATLTDQVVCVSQAVGQHARDVDGVPEERIMVLYYGIPLGEYAFNPTQPTNRFVYVGRLEPQKAPLNLLAAFATIAQEYPDSTLTIIGDGSLKSDCQCYVKEVGLDDRVHFLGYHIKPWQSAPPGSIFAHHCEFEGFGLTIAEAMASGHLCVLPTIGGIPEVAQAGTEAIFYRGDRDSLITAMRDALEMPVDQKLQMIQTARTRVERDFDAHQMAKKYLSLYQDLYIQEKGAFRT